MRKKLLTLGATLTMTVAMGMTAFAGNLSYQVTSGDTGKTATWTNPYSGQSMTIPVVTTDAKITLIGDMGQPIIDEYNTDGTLLINEGIMGDFSVYPTQEVDIADILNRLDSNRSSSAQEWQVSFPMEWVCFVGNAYGVPDVAFYVTSNPDSVAGTSKQPTSAGWKLDATGWWWQNNDGSWPANSWQWLDGNNDGVSECYYFNGAGYMLANTTTPDGYTVNADGAWTVNGIVQTQGAVAGT